MIKKLTIAAAAVILFVAAAAVFLISTIDSRIKSAVEDGCSRLTGTVVSVEDVIVSVFSGKGSLSGIVISNPQGFSSLPALSLDRILFEIDIGSISMDLIPVKFIHAHGAGILLEKNAEGKLNYKVLSRNLKTAEGDNVFGGETPAFWNPNLRISEFVLYDSKVTISGFGENSREVKLPELKLSDLGSHQGMPPERVGEEILSGIFAGVIRLSVTSGIQNWIENNSAIPESLKELLNQGLNSIN